MSEMTTARLIGMMARQARAKVEEAVNQRFMNPGDIEASVQMETALRDLRHYTEALDALTDRSPKVSPYAAGWSFVADVRDRMTPEAKARIALAAELEGRAAGTGAFAGLVVPATWAQYLRPSGQSIRPLADLLSKPLDDQEVNLAGTQATIPRVSTGAGASWQSSDNATVTVTDPATTGVVLPLRSAVTPAVVSWQFLDRGANGADAFVATELVGATEGLVEAGLINGSGSSGQPTGILNTGSVGSAAFGGTTAADFLDFLARQVATATPVNGAPPDTLVLAPRRWSWLLANAGDRVGAVEQTPIGYEGPLAGRCLNMDVVASPAMPLTLGAGTNEDRAIVMKRANVGFFESDALVDVNPESGAATLSARVNAIRYAAMGVIGDPAGVRVVTGLTNPY